VGTVPDVRHFLAGKFVPVCFVFSHCPGAASGIPWQYFLNIFLREALKKICHGIPEAEKLYLLILTTWD